MHVIRPCTRTHGRKEPQPDDQGTMIGGRLTFTYVSEEVSRSLVGWLVGSDNMSVAARRHTSLTRSSLDKATPARSIKQTDHPHHQTTGMHDLPPMKTGTCLYLCKEKQHYSSADQLAYKHPKEGHSSLGRFEVRGRQTAKDGQSKQFSWGQQKTKKSVCIKRKSTQSPALHQAHKPHRPYYYGVHCN